jgi:DNA-binding NtrC family response regulator
MSVDTNKSPCWPRDFGRILVVDDEPDFVETLGELLNATGFSADTTTDPANALERIARGDYALLIADLVMPGLDGMELLRRVRESSPDTEVVIATGYGTVETAVEAIRAGAADFLTKPFESRRIVEVIGRVMEMRRLRMENRRLRAQLAARPGPATSERLPDGLQSDATSSSPAGVSEGVAAPTRPLADVEREAIGAALERFEGNLSRAARELGVSRTSLYDRIGRYGLPTPSQYRSKDSYVSQD